MLNTVSRQSHNIITLNISDFFVAKLRYNALNKAICSKSLYFNLQLSASVFFCSGFLFLSYFLAFTLYKIRTTENTVINHFVQFHTNK